MNTQKIGYYILTKRKQACLTQAQLADTLCISPQAISKWERGEGLPDITLLIPLSEILETSVDALLHGGEPIKHYTKRIDLKAISTGIKTIAGLSSFISPNHLIYQGIIEGVNTKMNVDFEEILQDDFKLEAMIAEIVVTEIQEGGFLDRTEVQHYIHHEHWKNMIFKYQNMYQLD